MVAAVPTSRTRFHEFWRPQAAVRRTARAAIASVLLLLAGCSTGYTKVDGQWSYIAMRSFDREVRKMDVDEATFEVLADPDYARDKNHVFRYGFVLEGFDGASYRMLEDTSYAVDARHVYFRDSVIVGADIATFRVIGFPYSRDAMHVFCGALRMNVEDPGSFKVLSADRGRTSYCYSTDDLVRRFGDEFADVEVLYDPDAKDMKFCVALSPGSATDGIWFYAGPKRLRRAR